MKGNALAAIFFLSVLTLPSADAAFASNTPAYPEPRTLEGTSRAEASGDTFRDCAWKDDTRG
jgi:hypothetical protein